MQLPFKKVLTITLVTLLINLSIGFKLSATAPPEQSQPPITISQNRRSRPFVGLSAFAIANRNFPYARWVQAMDGVRKPMLAILWDTFGDSDGSVGTRRVRRFTRRNRDRLHVLEIHLLNQTCYDQATVPGRKCTRDEFAPRLDHDGFNQRLVASTQRGDRLRQAIKARVQEINTWVDSVKNNNTDIYLSTGLEDRYDNQAYDKMVQLIREAGWLHGIIRSPESPTNALRSEGSDFYESHPSTRRNATASRDNWPPVKDNCIVNLDGVSTPTPSSAGGDEELINSTEAKTFIKTHRDCFGVLLWHRDSQGKDTGNISPRNRDFALSDGDANTINDILKNWNRR